MKSGCWRRRVLPTGLLCDPRLHPVAQDLQRQRAAQQELVMKCANVEALTQGRLRFLAQRPEAQLADLVSERLARPGDVTFQFGLNVVRRERGVLREATARLLDVPTQPVNA